MTYQKSKELLEIYSTDRNWCFFLLYNLQSFGGWSLGYQDILMKDGCC